MSQSWTDNTYQGDHVAETDLQNIENNFAALKSMFSGGSAPSNPVAGMPWFDTTNLVMKYRDSSNAAWLGFMHGDTSQKIWVYRDSAMDGWAIDSTVSDKVLALKGGSIYVNGGDDTQGTWQQPDHTLTVSEIPAHDHGSAGAHTHTINIYPSDASGSYHPFGIQSVSSANGSETTSSDGAHTHSSVGGGGAHNHGNSWRPAAATGTLQYLNL